MTNEGTSRSRELLERLGRQVLVGDGAMGTLLHHRGVPLESNIEHLNLVRPDLVSAVHQDYVRAGSELLETNTFAANGLQLGAIGLAARVREINLAGARLARRAAGPQRFVAGAVGPLTLPRGEHEELEQEQKRRLFREQMEPLAEGGVDIFLLETFSDLEELELALRVAGEFGLPTAAQMAFLEGGNTRCGVSAEDAAGRLAEAGAAVLGANCGSGPKDLLTVLGRLAAATQLPLSAYPNSGFPEYRDGRLIYLATPDYFAERAMEMVRSGAALIGGCCGTTPEHVAALARAVSGNRPRRVVAAKPAGPPRRAAKKEPEAGAGFLDRWGERTVVTVELDPPKGLDCSKVLEGAERLGRCGVDAISLAENPLARIRMGNLALAQAIQQRTGIEVVAHVTGRDRNLIGLHSDLMGAHLMGLRNILAVTGDPVAVGGESGASSVFDLNSLGILRLLSALNRGENLLGADLGARTAFNVGAAFNPNLPSMDGQLRRLERKIEAGARFVQTQPVYSRSVADEMLERTAPFGIPVLVGVLPLVSGRNAEFLHNEVPGITLPQEVRRRMAGKSGPEGVREGMTIARELADHLRGRAGGFYLMPPFGKIELAEELITYLRG